MTKKLTKCAHCKARFKQEKRGRNAKYCSASCRQRVYVERRIAKEVSARLPVHLWSSDVNEIRSRDAIKEVVIDVLRELGIVPPNPNKTLSKPDLRLVSGKGSEVDPPSADPETS